MRSEEDLLEKISYFYFRFPRDEDQRQAGGDSAEDGEAEGPSGAELEAFDLLKMMNVIKIFSPLDCVWVLWRGDGSSIWYQLKYLNRNKSNSKPRDEYFYTNFPKLEDD